MVENITRVRFTVTKPIELHDGVVLRHGAYWGLMEKKGHDTLQGVDWAKPSYYVDLSDGQLARMGQSTRRAVRCDLTKLVEQGLIEAVEMAS